jgi:hypothetical protein
VKILKFTAQNIKGLKVVEIIPDSDVITISGPNGAGKSTVLDSIAALLCGGKLALSTGEKRGASEVDLGEFTIRKVVTEKSERLVVKNKDGKAFPSPRAFLDQFVGPLSINPMAFVRLDEREQLDVIFRLNPALENELAAADEKISANREERSTLLRDINRYGVALDAMPAHSPDLPPEPVSVAALAKKLQHCIEYNLGLDEEARGISKAKAQIDRENAAQAKQVAKLHQLQKEIEALEEAIEAKDRQIENLAVDLIRMENELKGKDRIDTAEIQKQIRTSESVNKEVQGNLDRARTEEELEDLKTLWSQKGIGLKEAEISRASILRDARMPLEGLGVEGRCVTYRGVKMAEISTAERVRVGASVAVAQNPKAKVILCDDVSLLDKQNLSALHEICAGFQIWQVVNDDSGEVGFYIEAGEVRNGPKGKDPVGVLEMPQGDPCGGPG